MDIRYTPEEIAFRDEVRAFFKENLPEEIKRNQMKGHRVSKEDIVTWQRILNAKGWAAPLWHREYGGPGWDAVQYYIFKEESYRAWAPDALSFNIGSVGPVLIAFGTDEQKKYFLPRLLNLDFWFCQGFSEPGAGSDLAGLRTHAVRDGDHYVINGQKMWTSGAHWADWMFCLVRTDNTARKQKGISYLLIDMKTPGITVRPIITLDGNHHTNETFFDNVRVPVANRIGEENRGWEYAKFLLGNERVGHARPGVSKALIAQAKALAAQVIVGDEPLSENRRFREKLALIEVETKALEMTNMMVVAQIKKGGNRPDPRTSVLKMKGSELQQSIHEVLLEVAGLQALPRLSKAQIMELATAGMVGPDWAAPLAPNYFIGRAKSIVAGSNEIQHNVVAKAVLGL